MVVTLHGSSRRFKYRLSSEVCIEGDRLKFVTRCICSGNSTDSSGRVCRRIMDASTVSGIEHLVFNHILMHFDYDVIRKVTLVTVYLKHFDKVTIGD